MTDKTLLHQAIDSPEDVAREYGVSADVVRCIVECAFALGALAQRRYRTANEHLDRLSRLMDEACVPESERAEL
jgi:hypothetical protein